MLGRLVFTSICRFGVLQVAWVCFQAGHSGAPHPTGGYRGSPGPQVMGAGGAREGPVPCASSLGRWLCRGGLAASATGALSCTGRDWGVLGALPRRGGLWDRAGRECRSTGLDVDEVGAYLLPNSFFPGLIGSRPWVSSAWLGKGCSVHLRPSGHKQEGKRGRGIVVGWFREARGPAVTSGLSLAVAHTVKGAVS